MKTGEKIKKFREDINLDIVEFSNSLSVSESLERQVECGAKNASREYMKKFKKKYPYADMNYIFFSN